MREPDERGLRTARQYAQWHIGDRYWADRVIRAYLNPEEVEAELALDKEEI